MTISFYKGLTRNPEIGNTPVWVLPIIWSWGKLEISNLAQTSLIKCYWMLQNARVFWVIKGKPTEGGGDKITPTQIRVKIKKHTNGYRNLILCSWTIVLEEVSIHFWKSSDDVTFFNNILVFKIKLVLLCSRSIFSLKKKKNVPLV